MIGQLLVIATDLLYAAGCWLRGYHVKHVEPWSWDD